MFRFTLAAAVLAVAGLAVHPARAEDMLTNGQTPPTPLSGNSPAQPTDGLPAGAGTELPPRAGTSLGTTTITPAPVSR